MTSLWNLPNRYAVTGIRMPEGAFYSDAERRCNPSSTASAKLRFVISHPKGWSTVPSTWRYAFAFI